MWFDKTFPIAIYRFQIKIEYCEVEINKWVYAHDEFIKEGIKIAA
jgi:hypothetical protein